MTPFGPIIRRRWPPTLYDVFGMSRETFERASLDRKRRICLRLIHPDRHLVDKDIGDDRRALIDVAYDILRSDALRATYDRMLARGSGVLERAPTYTDAASAIKELVSCAPPPPRRRWKARRQ